MPGDVEGALYAVVEGQVHPRFRRVQGRAVDQVLLHRLDHAVVEVMDAAHDLLPQLFEPEDEADGDRVAELANKGWALLAQR